MFVKEDFQGEDAKLILLGLQHTFTMFASVILVPKMLGLNISVAIFMAGIETLIFHAFTKGKVPIFLGSSFEYMPPCHPCLLLALYTEWNML